MFDHDINNVIIGYDKLKEYGFAIHGCVDGYSRYIVWMWVGYTNKKPEVVAKLYLRAGKENGCLPLTSRSDMGTETVYQSMMQMFVGGTTSHIYGTSTHNTRIESWWRILRETFNFQGWIEVFHSLKVTGEYVPTNTYQKVCAQFVFGPLITEELEQAVRVWNHHTIRKQKRNSLPHGKPHDLFKYPELKGGDPTIGLPVPENLEELAAGFTLQGTFDTVNLDDPFGINHLHDILAGALLGMRVTKANMVECFTQLRDDVELRDLVNPFLEQLPTPEAEEIV